MNWYKFHLGDYAKATSHLSWDEDCAYRRLLMAYYSHESPIPADAIYRIVRAVSKSQREAVKTVIKEFFTLKENCWHHAEADKEIANYQSKSAANKRIALQRWKPELVKSPPSDQS